MIVAAVPIRRTFDGKCWAFHVVNDSDQPLVVYVEQASSTWGPAGSTETIGKRFSIAPGASVVVHRETDTEMRTALTMRVQDAAGERRVFAEVGKLYATPRGLVPIPILGVPGMLAELDVISPEPPRPVAPPARAQPNRSARVEVDAARVRLELTDGRRIELAWSEIDAVYLLQSAKGWGYVLRVGYEEYRIRSDLAQASGFADCLWAQPGWDPDVRNDWAENHFGDGKHLLWRPPRGR